MSGLTSRRKCSSRRPAGDPSGCRLQSETCNSSNSSSARNVVLPAKVRIFDGNHNIKVITSVSEQTFFFFSLRLSGSPFHFFFLRVGCAEGDIFATHVSPSVAPLVLGYFLLGGRWSKNGFSAPPCFILAMFWPWLKRGLPLSFGRRRNAEPTE